MRRGFAEANGRTLALAKQNPHQIFCLGEQLITPYLDQFLSSIQKHEYVYLQAILLSADCGEKTIYEAEEFQKKVQISYETPANALVSQKYKAKEPN